MEVLSSKNTADSVYETPHYDVNLFPAYLKISVEKLSFFFKQWEAYTVFF